MSEQGECSPMPESADDGCSMALPSSETYSLIDVSQLCEVCRGIDIVTLFKGERTMSSCEFGTIGRIKTNLSCPSCDLVWLALNRMKKYGFHDATDREVRPFAFDDDWTVRVEVTAVMDCRSSIVWDRAKNIDERNSLEMKITLVLKDGVTFLARVIDFAVVMCPWEERMRSKYYVNIEGLEPDRIMSWLHQCLSEHTGCRGAEDTEVTDSESASTVPAAKANEIQLINVKERCIVEAPTTARYLTLSYKWGVPQQNFFAKTVAPARSRDVDKSGLKILDQQPAALVERTLPQTLEDAIILTEAIGEQYLWIDCLCVEQNDIKEKLRQILMMNQIYSGALLTIVALCGHNVNTGLFGVQPKSRNVPQLQKSFGKVTCFERMSRVDDHLDGSQWTSRGWTFQEGCLSRRSLVISCEQAFFICQTGIEMEGIFDRFLELKSWPFHFGRTKPPSLQDQTSWALSRGIRPSAFPADLYDSRTAISVGSYEEKESASGSYNDYGDPKWQGAHTSRTSGFSDDPLRNAPLKELLRHWSPKVPWYESHLSGSLENYQLDSDYGTERDHQEDDGYDDGIAHAARRTHPGRTEEDLLRVRTANLKTMAGMVEDYCCRKLTRAMDSLLAFNGILDHLKQTQKMDFLHGHPVDCMGPSLLWCVLFQGNTWTRFDEEERSRFEQEKPYPSWAWPMTTKPLKFLCTMFTVKAVEEFTRIPELPDVVFSAVFADGRRYSIASDELPTSEIPNGKTILEFKTVTLRGFMAEFRPSGSYNGVLESPIQLKANDHRPHADTGAYMRYDEKLDPLPEGFEGLEIVLTTNIAWKSVLLPRNTFYITALIVVPKGDGTVRRIGVMTLPVETLLGTELRYRMEEKHIRLA